MAPTANFNEDFEIELDELSYQKEEIKLSSCIKNLSKEELKESYTEIKKIENKKNFDSKKIKQASEKIKCSLARDGKSQEVFVKELKKKEKKKKKKKKYEEKNKEEIKILNWNIQILPSLQNGKAQGKLLSLKAKVQKWNPHILYIQELRRPEQIDKETLEDLLFQFFPEYDQHYNIFKASEQRCYYKRPLKINNFKSLNSFKMKRNRKIAKQKAKDYFEKNKAQKNLNKKEILKKLEEEEFKKIQEEDNNMEELEKEFYEKAQYIDKEDPYEYSEVLLVRKDVQTVVSRDENILIIRDYGLAFFYLRPKKSMPMKEVHKYLHYLENFICIGDMNLKTHKNIQEFLENNDNEILGEESNQSILITPKNQMGNITLKFDDTIYSDHVICCYKIPQIKINMKKVINKIDKIHHIKKTKEWILNSLTNQKYNHTEILLRNKVTADNFSYAYLEKLKFKRFLNAPIKNEKKMNLKILARLNTRSTKDFWKILSCQFKSRKKESFYLKPIPEKVALEFKARFNHDENKIKIDLFTTLNQYLKLYNNNQIISKESYKIGKDLTSFRSIKRSYSEALDAYGISQREFNKTFENIFTNSLRSKTSFQNMYDQEVRPTHKPKFNDPNDAREFYKYAMILQSTLTDSYIYLLISGLLNINYKSNNQLICKTVTLLKQPKDGSKIEDPRSIKDIRLLGIVPAFLKLLSATITPKVSEFVSKIVNKDERYQYGFFKGCSTTDAVIRVAEIMQENMDKSEISESSQKTDENVEIAVLYDISAAYDSVPLMKLKEMIEENISEEYNPVERKMLMILMDFQFHCDYFIGDIEIKRTYGVITGEESSCALWNLFFHFVLKKFFQDFNEENENCYLSFYDITAYADDLIMKMKAKDFEKITNALNKTFAEFNLTLNMAKTEILIADQNKKMIKDLKSCNLVTQNKIIPNEVVKYLGVNLKWDDNAYYSLRKRLIIDYDLSIKQIYSHLDSINKFPFITRLQIINSFSIANWRYSFIIENRISGTKRIDGNFIKIIKKATFNLFENISYYETFSLIEFPFNFKLESIIHRIWKITKEDYKDDIINEFRELPYDYPYQSIKKRDEYLYPDTHHRRAKSWILTRFLEELKEHFDFIIKPSSCVYDRVVDSANNIMYIDLSREIEIHVMAMIIAKNRENLVDLKQASNYLRLEILSCIMKDKKKEEEKKGKYKEEDLFYGGMGLHNLEGYQRFLTILILHKNFFENLKEEKEGIRKLKFLTQLAATLISNTAPKIKDLYKHMNKVNKEQRKLNIEKAIFNKKKLNFELSTKEILEAEENQKFVAKAKEFFLTEDNIQDYQPDLGTFSFKKAKEELLKISEIKEAKKFLRILVKAKLFIKNHFDNFFNCIEFTMMKQLIDDLKQKLFTIEYAILECKFSNQNDIIDFLVNNQLSMHDEDPAYTQESIFTKNNFNSVNDEYARILGKDDPPEGANMETDIFKNPLFKEKAKKIMEAVDSAMENHKKDMLEKLKFEEDLLEKEEAIEILDQIKLKQVLEEEEYEDYNPNEDLETPKDRSYESIPASPFNESDYKKKIKEKVLKQQQIINNNENLINNSTMKKIDFNSQKNYNNKKLDFNGDEKNFIMEDFKWKKTPLISKSARKQDLQEDEYPIPGMLDNFPTYEIPNTDNPKIVKSIDEAMLEGHLYINYINKNFNEKNQKRIEEENLIIDEFYTKNKVFYDNLLSISKELPNNEISLDSISTIREYSIPYQNSEDKEFNLKSYIAESSKHESRMDLESSDEVCKDIGGDGCV